MCVVCEEKALSPEGKARRQVLQGRGNRQSIENLEDEKVLCYLPGSLILLLAEMEKRADRAVLSVLFFSLVVLIFWLYTRKLAKTAVLLALC